MPSEPSSEQRALAPFWIKLVLAAGAALTTAALATSCSRDQARHGDLPRQEDRWVQSVVLDSASSLKFVGKTKDYLITTLSAVRPVDGLRKVSVGDEIEGIRIGAIRCSFFWRDASYGAEKYMWRGQWGCIAGRSKEEVASAVGSDGAKRFTYLYVAPVSMIE